jgi:hypothetical protein
MAMLRSCKQPKETEMNAEAIRREAMKLLEQADRLERQEESANREEREQDIERATGQLELLPNGSIIWWSKRFASSETVYTWASVKAGGKWSLTGNATTNKWRSSAQLARFIDEHPAPGTKPLREVRVVNLMIDGGPLL